MIYNPSKLMLIAVAFATSLAASVSSAEPGKSQGAGGWEPSADQQEFVVVALKTDPTHGEDISEITESAEPACVALQIATNLLKDIVDVNDNHIPVTPADRVVLFTTIGGVEIINPDDAKQAILDNPTVCFAPFDGGMTQSLNQLLDKFVAAGGEILVCPLCAISRGITPQPPATMANAEAIHNLFLYADKVVDF